jgi:TPR repeat protein
MLAVGLTVVVGLAQAGALEDALGALARHDYKAALQLIEPLAQKGNANAQAVLGQCYSLGHGVAVDPAQAVQWTRKAAVQGHVAAQTNLGLAYDTGQGVEQDQAQAVRWYSLAAAQGDAVAQTNLALMYDTGAGVAQSATQALRFFRMAAVQGNATAQFNLGLIYGTGTDAIASDPVRAYLWFTLAAQAGEPNATRNRRVVETRLSAAQLQQAQQLVQTCRAKPLADCD